MIELEEPLHIIHHLIEYIYNREVVIKREDLNDFIALGEKLLILMRKEKINQNSLDLQSSSNNLPDAIDQISPQQNESKVPPPTASGDKENKRFICEKCNTGYASMGNLRRHIKHKCGGNTPDHRCPICDKRFGYKHTVKQHLLRIHQKELTPEVIEKFGDNYRLF